MTALLRWTLAFALLVPASVARADKHLVQIVIAERNGADRACADALMNTRSTLKGAIDGDFRIVTFPELKEDNAAAAVIYVATPDNSIDLIAVPFAFRDARHYQAYLKSDLGSLMLSRTILEPTAIAYGGFFQLFSRAAAVTEPEHLYGRHVGGNARGLMVYLAFGAQADPSAFLAMFDLNFSPADDFALMGQDRVGGQIVEAVLGQAFENGADRNARYVNLASSGVSSIYIKARVGREVWQDWSVSPDLEAQLLKWEQGAATTCSVTNYNTELNVLDRLKQAGLTIVPVNRKALVETSFRLALTKEHPYWTIAEFDRVEQLGGDPSDVLLPSDIVGKLSNAERQKALNFDQAAIKFIGEITPKSR